MNSVNSVDTCEHLFGARAQWVKNDGTGPPVLYVYGDDGEKILVLSNKTIVILCPSCFQQRRECLSSQRVKIVHN